MGDEHWAAGVREYRAEARQNDQTTAGLACFEQAVSVTDQKDPARLLFLATLLYRAGRHQEAEAYYYQVLDSAPLCGHGYLELVLFLESSGRREEARAVARRAIHAGALWADEWQRCPIFVKGLTARAWWAKEDFPWASDLEKAYPDIKAELDGLLGRDLSSWARVGDERATHDGDIVSGGDWREFLLYSAQDVNPSTANPEVLELFPKTCAVLEHLLPGAVAMAKIGVGEIILSALAPGTQLAPHCASSNVRLTCHLGLVCPTGARVRVGAEWGTWEEGKCIFFDDSYEHEVVNDAASIRIVLLIRFWHPELLPEQWLPTLNQGMEGFGAMLARRVTPPINCAVAELLGESADQLWSSVVPSAAALLKADAPDLAAGNLKLLEVKEAPRGSLLAPLVCALQDKDPRLVSLTGYQLMKHGYGQPAGVGLAAIRTAAGDEAGGHPEDEGFRSQTAASGGRDWWCLSAAITLALALAGSAKTKAWEVLLDWGAQVGGPQRLPVQGASATSHHMSVSQLLNIKEGRLDASQYHQLDREKKPLWRQCLDRSGGIGKGQVRGFVQLMRSDLDLATKNGFMEALRLTISPKRLLRFVKHGGVTRVVLWLERALGESSSPELETFLENSLKSLRMLNLRAMDQSSAQSLVELIQRLRQRLQVGRKGADSAAKAAVPAAPRTPPQAAPRTPPKRNAGPPPRNRAPVIRVDRAEREPRATGELKPPASPVSAAAVPFAPPLGAQPKTPPLRWTEPKDAKPLLFGEKSPKALLFQAPAFKAAPGEKAEVQKVLFQAPASKAPPEGRAEVQKVSSVIALDEAVATPVHRSPSAIQAVPRARPSCLVLLAQPSTPELDANPVSPETEPKVQEKPSPELPQQPPVPKLTSASPKAKPPAKDDAKVPAAFRGKEKARVPAAFRAKEKARLWAEESLRVATPKAATSAAASVDAAFVDADAGAELPVKFERKRPAPRVVPPPRRKWARLAPEATEEPISHPETEDALQEEWWHQQQQQVAAEFLFAAVPEEEMDLAAPVEPQEWSFQEDLGLDKSDEEMVKQDHEEAENEEMAEAPEESVGETLEALDALDALEAQVSFEALRVARLERQLETGHAAGDAGDAGEAGDADAEDTEEDTEAEEVGVAHEVGKTLGVPPESLLAAPATPPRTTSAAANRAAPRTPPLTAPDPQSPPPRAPFARAPLVPQSPEMVIPTGGGEEGPKTTNPEWTAAAESAQFATSLEELVRSAPLNIPVEVKSEDALTSALVRAVLEACPELQGAVPENPVEPQICSAASTMFAHAMGSYTDSLLMTSAATSIAETFLASSQGESYCCVESPCFLWGRSLTEPQVAKAKQHWAHSGVACRYLCQAEPSCRVWVFHIPASDDLELAGPCLLSDEELPEISAQSEAAVAGRRFCAPAALAWAAEVRRDTLETLEAAGEAADAAAQLRREGWAVLRGVLPPLQRQLLRRAAEATSASLLAKDPQRLGNRGPRRYSWGGASSSHHMVHHAAWAQLLGQPWLLPVLQEAFGAEFMAVGGGGDFVLGDTDSHQRLHVDLQLEEMYDQDSPAAIVANFVVSEIGCRDGPLRTGEGLGLCHPPAKGGLSGGAAELVLCPPLSSKPGGRHLAGHAALARGLSKSGPRAEISALRRVPVDVVRGCGKARADGPLHPAPGAAAGAVAPHAARGAADLPPDLGGAGGGESLAAGGGGADVALRRGGTPMMSKELSRCATPRPTLWA
ncbi:unnamed protein product [Effrenium voratum]|nr:unnamed protein product [Effrenium voratum]